MELPLSPSTNPIEHARNIEEILASLKDLCRHEVKAFHDPKARALLETSAEVLGGLEKAFHDFLEKGEAWKERDDDLGPSRKSSDPWD